MKLVYLSAEDLRAALPMTGAAAAAMTEAFAARPAGEAVQPPRTHLEVAPRRAVSVLSGAFLPGPGLAAKVISVQDVAA